MSGSIGANRIPRAAVETTLKAYIDKVLKKFPGFKSAKISGSYNTTVKPDHGDIDLVINIEGDEQDRKKLKQNFAAYISSLPDDITIPFTSGRHVGKKAAGTGDIVIVQFAIEGYPDLTVQIDNMIVASEQESEYRKSFLDLPAEKQGLLVGLAKAQLLEEDPIEIFKRLGITNIPKLDKNQELEFNLSNKGLTLRLVTLGDNFKELGRNEIWTSFNWSDVEKLFKDYKLDGTWEELLESINSKLKNSRSRNRVKGIFNSLVVINAGEAGTDKGNNKLKAKETVDKLLENMLFKGLVKELIMPLLEDEFQETIAIYPGKFKPPHKGHFEVAKQLIGKVDKIIIAISAKEHDGITAQQSEAVWKLYNTLLDGKLDIEIIKGAPVGYVLDTIKENPNNHYVAVYGKGEESRYKAIGKDPRYMNAEIFDGGTAEDEEGKIDASNLRIALNKNKNISKFLPKGITPEKYKQALGIDKTINESFYKQSIQHAIQEDIDTWGMLPEYKIDLNNTYDYEKKGDFYSFYDDVNNCDIIVKLKNLPSGLVEFKFYPVKDNNILGFIKLKQINPKIMNTVYKIFQDEVLIKYNSILIQPSGYTRYRLFRAMLNNNIDKNKFDVKVKDDLDEPYIIVQKKETINELEDHEIKYWALHADLYKALKNNPYEEYEILKNELKGERLKALNYFYYSYLSKDAPKKFSKDKEQKLRIFDFDDTLAHVNATIYITHKDGTEEELTPAEYAIYEPQPGDTSNFREFNAVIKNASPIEKNINLLKQAASDSNTRVTILTARGLGYPVKKYLKDKFNLNIYVVALGSSDPQKKAEYIEDQIKKGYSDIEFIDDSTKNVNAVNQLKLKYPDIRLNAEIAENILLENTSFQPLDFKTHLASLTKYMVDQGMNIKPYPALKIINNDFKNAENMLGKTAYYDPTNCSITLFTLNRHPKDILRSYAHEMIHRMQDNEGRLKNITTTNTNEDGDLEELEKEAYLKGNMCFRNWEDSIKNKKYIKEYKEYVLNELFEKDLPNIEKLNSYEYKVGDGQDIEALYYFRQASLDPNDFEIHWKFTENNKNTSSKAWSQVTATSYKIIKHFIDDKNPRYIEISGNTDEKTRLYKSKSYLEKLENMFNNQYKIDNSNQYVVYLKKIEEVCKSGIKKRMETLNESYEQSLDYWKNGDLNAKSKIERWDSSKRKIKREVLQEVYNIKNVKPLNEWIVDIPKYNYTPKLSNKIFSQLHELKINEIALNSNNAVEIYGSLTNGEFTVGEHDYNYRIIKLDKNPYNSNLFYNIDFHEIGNKNPNPSSPTGNAKENYIKILSTMYKIILDFTEEEKPEYIGISSLDESGYGNIYNNLTKTNKIPNYSRKDAGLQFKDKDGKTGKFIILKRNKI